VDLAREPGSAIVKCHKYLGRGVAEARQLDELRRHALVKVPEVYAVYLPAPDFPAETLIMETIPGINASKVQFPDPRTRARFVDAVVENLLAWHAVPSPTGYGDLDGPFYASWTDCFGARVSGLHTCVHQSPYRDGVSDQVMGIIDRSFAATAEIFQGAHGDACLVHSDYNAWNMMVDPETYALAGVIDPIDAGWSDREIDLFHLPNCRPELGLLERYLQEMEPDDDFWMRFWFYRFWDDVKHYVRMGWYQEEHFRHYGGKLVAAMAARGL
jgi:aminoglycoside phosphotransferase (APT) family kinase protein